MNMSKSLILIVLVISLFFLLDCADAQVREGPTLRILYTGDTWGYIVPSG